MEFTDMPTIATMTLEWRGISLLKFLGIDRSLWEYVENDPVGPFTGYRYVW